VLNNTFPGFPCYQEKERRTAMKPWVSNKAFLLPSILAMWLLSVLSGKAFSQWVPPNFILFMTDDQGYQDLGCYGSPLIDTPVIDRMAHEGIRFTSFYAAHHLCSPSRAGWMTGCYPRRVGFGPWVLFPHDKYGLNPEEITIADLLKTRGYATALMGKWHLGDQSVFLPTRQGFDHYLGTPCSNDMTPLDLYRDEELIETLQTSSEQEKLTHLYTDEAIQFINQHKDNPFFLCVAYNMPHVPLHPSDAFEGTSARGPYGDVIEEIDFNVGRVLDALKDLGIDDKTLVVFTSDNGPWVEMGESGGSADPLRGGKGTNWEGGMRVPCVMRWPTQIPAGQVNSEIATFMDLYPTLARLAGADLPSGQVGGVDIVIDGMDIWPLMAGEPGATTPHQAFYYDLNAVRSGNWKLKEGSLLDLENDIHEDNDLASSYPEERDQLQQLLDEFSQEVRENARPPGSFQPLWSPSSTLEADSSSFSNPLNCILALIVPVIAILLWKGRRERR
jgi:arylsulfatase A